MRDTLSTIFGIVSIIGMIVLTGYMLLAVDNISKWERANGYPYGRMCDPNIFNLYHSTCPVR